MFKIKALSAAVVALAALPPCASATVLIEKTLEELTLEADAVVMGTVSEVWTAREAATDLVRSYAELEVSRWVKGENAGNRVVANTVGGDVGELSVSVPGAPRFLEGEQMLLFLGSKNTTLTNVVGWQQGALHIRDGLVVETGAPVGAFLRRVEAILDGANR
jgi:hypothetical protein